MFTLTNPFAPRQPQVKINAPWSNRSKILCGAFVAGCVGSTASVIHDFKVAAEDALIPDAAIDKMLADPTETGTSATTEAVAG